MARNLAVIGCGSRGKDLARVFSELGALELVCDRDASRAGAIVVHGAPPTFTESVNDLLSHSAIEAVAVAAPAATHFELVKRCLEAAKDVFVEEPLALTAREGQELVELAQHSLESSWLGTSCFTIRRSCGYGNWSMGGAWGECSTVIRTAST